MNNELNSIGLNKRPSETTVVVAMSGGVDSSTVAGIMKKEGYKVIGITLKLYDEINDYKIKDKLKELTNDAFEKNIFGAPTFVVNNKLFWGQDRLDYALDEYNS